MTAEINGAEIPNFEFDEKVDFPVLIPPDDGKVAYIDWCSFEEDTVIARHIREGLSLSPKEWIKYSESIAKLRDVYGFYDASLHFIENKEGRHELQSVVLSGGICMYSKFNPDKICSYQKAVLDNVYSLEYGMFFMDCLVTYLEHCGVKVPHIETVGDKEYHIALPYDLDNGKFEQRVNGMAHPIRSPMVMYNGNIDWKGEKVIATYVDEKGQNILVSDRLKSLEDAVKIFSLLSSVVKSP